MAYGYSSGKHHAIQPVGDSVPLSRIGAGWRLAADGRSGLTGTNQEEYRSEAVFQAYGAKNLIDTSRKPDRIRCN